MTPAGLRQLRYGRIERERRFLLARLPDGPITGGTAIEDRYLPDTRLRLRRMAEPGGEVAYKLARKLPPHASGAGVMGNLYLTAAEHAVLAALPAHALTKTRHAIAGWSVDVFAGALAGLVTAEREVDDDAALQALAPPFPFLAEVTDDPRFAGARLAADPGPALAELRRLRGG